MGAGAGKQFQSDKTKHAEVVLQAVQSYERAHPGEVPSDNFSFQSHLFKRRVLLAVAESKRRGKDIDASLQQLTDADLETLFHYIESNRNNKLKPKDASQIIPEDQQSRSSTMNSTAAGAANVNNLQVSSNTMETRDFDLGKGVTHGSNTSDALAKSTASDANHAMTVEEFVEEDFNGGDNIDETTSVLSYGDDDRDNDSEAEVESSGSLLIHRPTSKKSQNKDDSSDEIVEDLEVLDESNRQLSFEMGKKDPMRASGAKIFPSEDAKTIPKEQRIAQTLAKFWEIDEIGAVGSQLDLGMESPHPFSPFVAKSDKTMNGTRIGSGYKDRGQKIDERNERLMGLQRQKVMSYTQNAQLEREVEALQKQLEKMEELERSMEMSPTTTKLSHSMASSASTVQASADKYNSNHSVKHQDTSRKSSNRYSYIYPIDEEANEWPGSGKDHNRHVAEHKISPDLANNDRRTNFRGAKRASYSSSDSDEDFISQSTGAIDRLLSDDKVSKSGSNYKQIGKIETKDTVTPASQSKPVKHIVRQRRRGNAANASSGVDSDDSATSNYSGASNNNPRRVKNAQNSVALSGNASDSDNVLQPLSARAKGSSNSVTGNVPNRRPVAEKDKRALSQIMAPTQNNQSNSIGNAPLGQVNNSSPKKSISDARRARNTIGTEENKARISKHPINDINSETEEAMKAQDESLGEPKRQASLKKLNKRRHSVDGVVPSPIKESSSSNIPIDNPITLEKAISALKDVNNNPSAAIEKLLTPEKSKLGPFDLHDAGNSKPRAGNRSRPVRKEKDEKNTIAASQHKHVLKDDEFEALFAEDSIHGSDENMVQRQPVDVGTIPSQALARKKKTKGAAKACDIINPKPAESDAEKPNKIWNDELDHKWIEVSYLLRQPIKSEEDMLYAAASAEAGIMFTDQMNSIAKSLNVLRGQLSRWILPFDSNTRIDTQCSTPHSVTENMPDEFRGKLTERQVHYLVAGANGVRKLVRIKIADDNDLEQARKALQTTNSFFKDLYERAEIVGMTPYELLQKAGPVF